MTTWSTPRLETTLLFSPVGLRLLDELTNQPPLGRVQAFLDLFDSSGNWQQTRIQPVVTVGSVWCYPGFGRQTNVAAKPPQKCRIRLAAEFYLPYYLKSADSIPFNAYPYNDSTPPAVITGLAIDTQLLPAPNYPFASHISVLRGKVVDSAGASVANTYVTQSNSERTLTDARGTFALPLRWSKSNTPIAIDATDRSGRTGSISIQIPAALTSSQKITIT